MMKSKTNLFLTLTTVLMVVFESFTICAAENPVLKSAKLCFEIQDSNVAGKDIFINGQKTGEVPINRNNEMEKVSVNITGNLLSAIATVNIVNIENKPVNPKAPNDKKDIFKVKNVYLEVTDTNNNPIKSNIEEGPFLSFKTGFIELADGKREYTYIGAHLPEIRLALPSDKIGYIKQPFFDVRTGELYRNNSPRKWNGLDKAALLGPKRTMCDITNSAFVFHTKEYLLDMMDRYNSDILLITFWEERLKKQKDKIEFLRQHGIKINLMYSPGIIRDPYKRLPESAEYKIFFKTLSEWAPLVDEVGMDEWFLSPAMLQTDGGIVTEITENFIDAFAKYSGYSHEDAKWAFKNHTSDDPRTLKAWEFCAKAQNDVAKEFVRVAKNANPKIRTWTSYITKNWNKHVTCMDTALGDFDEILQCQTYWYGRGAKDALNSPLLTAPMGMGKIFKSEYPDKFLWMGIDPFYTGGRNDSANENSWGIKHYSNTIEEVVPYLALLYATSNGVFIQNFEGKGMLGYTAKEKQYEYLSHLGVDGAYVDKFADAVNLISKVVPFIKTYKKSDVAYYYDPDADFEIIRRVNKYIASRETNETAIGLLEEFCDVDVTKDISKYKNVIYAGMLLPGKFDYKKQDIYLMYAPGYDEKGNKISEVQLVEKLNIKGFEPLGKNFFPAESNENGCKDQLQIADLPKDTLASGMIIKGASYPIRKTAYSGSSDYFLIGARNKGGNVLINSLWPSFTRQDMARKIIKKDLDYFGWTKRDCPQVNGTDKIVAVAFRDARTAVLDFGIDASFSKIKILMFNGREGIIRNETIPYNRGMKIELPPLNVLVSEGIK